MTLDDLIHPSLPTRVNALGLHKIAGAMHALPELTTADAVTILGARAYMRRKEARVIADGIAALAVLTRALQK